MVSILELQASMQRLVLGLSYIGFALGYVPGLRMNRATIALTSSALLIASGDLSLADWNKFYYV